MHLTTRTFEGSRSTANRLHAVLAALLLSVLPSLLTGQVVVRSYTPETRYHHVELPVGGLALARLEAPESGLDVEGIVVHLVNTGADSARADVVLVDGGSDWMKLPRPDLLPPVRVSIPPRSDLPLIVTLPRPVRLPPRSVTYAGIVTFSAALTLRMDRSGSMSAVGSHTRTAPNVFGLPDASTGRIRYGAKFSDGRSVGRWYVELHGSTPAVAVTEPRTSGSASANVTAVQDAITDAPESVDTHPSTPSPDGPVTRDQGLVVQRPERILPVERQNGRSTPGSVCRVALHVIEPCLLEVRIQGTGGELVRVLHADSTGAGPRFLAWDGRNDAGSLCAAGPYDLVIRVNGSLREHRRIMYTTTGVGE